MKTQNKRKLLNLEQKFAKQEALKGKIDTPKLFKTVPCRTFSSKPQIPRFMCGQCLRESLLQTFHGRRLRFTTGLVLNNLNCWGT